MAANDLTLTLNSVLIECLGVTLEFEGVALEFQARHLLCRIRDEFGPLT
jgi:hypothetical protein